MKPGELFIEVVRGCQDLPAEVRNHAADASGVKESCFDESYLQFLDEQIQLSPRGPEWAVILRRRRESLRPFCGVPLVDGHIRVGGLDTWVKIDPKTRAVVFWEQLKYEQAS